MTDVLVRLTAASSGAAASGWVPADEVAAVGHLECRPWAPDADGARLHLEAPDRLLLPASFTVRLVAGEALLHLAPTGAGWCWQIVERTPCGKTRYVLVPDSVATLDYADLVDVDPATLAPAAAAVPAWEAAVSAVEGYAQAAADSAALAASEADSVEQTIAAEVQDWLDANPPAAGDDGREVEFGMSASHVQWRYVGDVAWADLIALSSLVGATGAPPELQATATHLQWRVPGGMWADLVALADLRGPQGDPGPSAYEVAVAAGFVGSEAAWLASLKGDEGDPAPLPAFTATATTGAPGTNAAASVSGAYPNLSLDLTIPEGEQGNPGPPNSLAIGTVTTGAPGSAAAASVTGTAPSQTLNLTIPTGATGAVSAWEYYAAGRPDVVGTLDAAALAWRNAAPSGSTFYSTNGPQGAWVWRKRGATWVCVEGATGVIDWIVWTAAETPTLPAGLARIAGKDGYLRRWRTASTIGLIFQRVAVDAASQVIVADDTWLPAPRTYYTQPFHYGANSFGGVAIAPSYVRLGGGLTFDTPFPVLITYPADGNPWPLTV